MGRTAHNNVKWTTGRSTIQRVTKQNKVLATMRGKAQNFSARPMTAFHSQKGK